MKRAWVAALGVVLCAPSGMLLAQQRPGPPSFDSLDTNHDGVLSKDEVQAMFDRFANRGGGRRGGFGGGENDGGGQGGGQAARPRRDPDEIFKSWDKDGNGSISREEFDARPRFGGRGGRGPGGGGPGPGAPQI